MKTVHNEREALFSSTDEIFIDKFNRGKRHNFNAIKLSGDILNRLQNYRLEEYVSDIKTLGLEKTWNYICQFAIDYKDKMPKFLNISNFGELYEIGLATQNKILKKKSGQYYTPDDVARIMSEWLNQCDGTQVCDVGCGTGKLILTYFDLIGFNATRKLISEGKLYLYDCDKVALKICKTIIATKYGLDIADAIHDILCDFLDPLIILPDDCKVISNPPYAHINIIQDYWEHTDVLNQSKEMYSVFMEKIFLQAKSSVIITPFSFINGSKFSSLRRIMCDQGNGFILSFDNVPGNIFCGRKHGIFNTNTANSVRAAITILNRSDEIKGFKVSPLIRFKNEERKKLLQCKALEKMLPSNYQIVNIAKNEFAKVHKTLKPVFDLWISKSEYCIKDIIAREKTKYMLDIPNTCRYFTTASSRKLQRTGSMTIYLKNMEDFSFIYCIINSSFAYWWWRIFDGGITYPVRLLNNMPLPINLLAKEDKKFFENTCKEMRELEGKCIVTKVNAGVAQENLKFPNEYRLMINSRLLKVLGYETDCDIFKIIHSNKFIEG